MVRNFIVLLILLNQYSILFIILLFLFILFLLLMKISNK